MTGTVSVLLERDESATDVEVDDEPGHRAGVHDLRDGARRGAGAVRRLGPGRSDGELLRPDAVGAAAPRRTLRLLAAEQVGGADETGDEGVGRLLVDVAGAADLLDAPLVEDRDPVAEGERLLLVVGDEQERDADVALDLLELHLHLLAQLQVECTQRLVEEQHLRPVHQSPRQRDPLALPAREPDPLEGLVGPVSSIPLGDLLHEHSVLHVLLDAHVRKDRVVLEDRVHVPGVRRSPSHVLAGQLDRAFRRLLEPGDHPQHRGLPGAGRPQHREELTRPDTEVHVVDGHHRGPSGELLAHAGQADRRCARPGSRVGR